MRSKDEQKMKRIIEYVEERYFSDGEIPTLQEIADVMVMTKSNVSGYLKAMEERGMLSLSGGQRGICTKKMGKAAGGIMQIPVVGSVACGAPMLAEENVLSYLYISASFFGRGDYFALCAHGESMINSGISDGDFVIIRKQNTAENGQIVVALIDDCATLKRFYRDDEKHLVRLHPENDEMEDMYFEDIAVLGVAVKVVKDLE